MVIGGYTDPQGSRTHFGALLIGYYEGKTLKFAGKVGTGFDEALLRELHARVRSLAQEKCPFTNITQPDMRHSHWLKPRLVCQVEFAEWTRDGKLRQPVFLGLREDKAASEVVRES